MDSTYAYVQKVHIKCPPMRPIRLLVCRFLQISIGDGSGIKDVPCLAACEDQLNLGWMRAAVANIHSLHQHANADMHSAACFALVAGLV